MSDIIGGENHFPLGFGSADRTFDLDFGAGDSAFGLDFGSAIIGGSSLPPTDNAEAGYALRLFRLLSGKLEPMWLPDFNPVFFRFRLDDDGNVIQGPTWAEILAVEEDRLVVATVSTPMFARVYHLVCFSHRASGALSPTTIIFGGAIEDSIITIFNGETEDSWETNLFAVSSAIDDAIGGFSESVIGDLEDLTTEEKENIVAAINEVAGHEGYEKPSGGIPKSDLASDVQTSLGKADTALQSESDPTVPAWAKAPQKPSYTASEVGALPADTSIPTKVSDLTNDSGFVNAAGAAAAAPVQSVNGKTGAVSLAASDVGAYAKPSGGIPKTDLASDVQTSLGKADTALQQHQSLAAYRTSAAQDVIDAAQDTAIAGKLPTTGNAYRAASIPMGHLDSTSTATVMTATVPGITELRDGVCVWLRNGVVASASGVTLNINSLGAKPIYNSLSGAVVTTTFTAASTYLFVYNATRVTGGCWDMVYGYDANTTYTPVKLGFGYATCSTAEATAAKTAALSSYTLTTGGIVAVKFANAVPAGATLNINSKGAKAIYYKGAAITAGVIKAGDTVTMIYSTYYHVLSIDRDVDTLPPSPSDADPLMDGTASPGSSADYARADHVHPSDSSKIGYDDEPNMVTMTASGSTVTCFKSFLEIYVIFYSQRNAYFILAASQTDYQLFNLDRVDGGNQTIYLSSIVGGVLSQIVLTPGGSSTMTGTLTTIDLNLQSASGVSF